MKKILFLLIFILCVGTSLWAQSNKSVHEGYYNLTQMSFIIGEVSYNSAVKSEMIPSVVNINGYRVNEYFSVGVGVGMTPLPYTIFPVFADFRVILLKSNLSPVLAFKGGYAFANSKKDIWGYGSDNKNTGGAMVNPEVGFKIPMTERADFMLTIGYWYQHIESEFTGYNSQYNRKSDLNRLSFSIGFLFK